MSGASLLGVTVRIGKKDVRKRCHPTLRVTFFDADVAGEVDLIEGVSDCVIVGKTMASGTGDPLVTCSVSRTLFLVAPSLKALLPWLSIIFIKPQFNYAIFPE